MNNDTRPTPDARQEGKQVTEPTIIDVNLQHSNVTTRWPCAICAGSTWKTDILAAFTHPIDGREAFVCEQCFAAGPDAINARMIETAEHFEAVARRYRQMAAADPVWNMPTQDDKERWEAEIHQRWEKEHGEFPVYAEPVAADTGPPF